MLWFESTSEVELFWLKFLVCLCFPDEEQRVVYKIFNFSWSIKLKKWQSFRNFITDSITGYDLHFSFKRTSKIQLFSFKALVRFGLAINCMQRRAYSDIFTWEACCMLYNQMIHIKIRIENLKFTSLDNITKIQ